MNYTAKSKTARVVHGNLIWIILKVEKRVNDGRKISNKQNISYNDD
jgi:hypothetical protein